MTAFRGRLASGSLGLRDILARGLVDLLFEGRLTRTLNSSPSPPLLALDL